MRYLCMYKPVAAEGTTPSSDDFARMGKLCEEMFKAGVLLQTEGCQPSANGMRVTLSHGAFSIKDGPFTESKELVAGIAVIQAKTKEEAVTWIKRFLETAGDGQSEVRALHTYEDFAPGGAFEPDKAVAK